VDVHIDDDGFVRAPAPLVYRRLTDVLGWPRWWPGVRVEPRPSEGDDEVVALDLATAPARRLRLSARLHGWRHDQGFALELHGRVSGRAEFWLEPGWGGTVVHHLLVGRIDGPRPLAVHGDYRRVVRRGLWGLKDAVELEVRTGAGAPP
jgi:hypothetical protein